jgi:hypothetical protein
VLGLSSCLRSDTLDTRDMALAQNGTRRIDVGGVIYRWTVAPDDEPGVAAVVELFSTPAQRVVGWVDHGVTITPGLVRRLIGDALEQGWTPTAPGADFVMRHDGEAFRVRPVR